jgi:hypothetical protein
MKRNLLTTFASAAAALTLTTAAYARYLPVSDDGIAASPRARQMLNARTASAWVTPPAPACAKCVDVRSSKLLPQAKGVGALLGTQQVSYIHGCASCDTKLTVAGEGKAKQQVATHTCSMDAASTGGCCASK